MELNETAYQMLLSPDWTNVETAMLLLISQHDTEQRAYLSRLLSECTMHCYKELCDDEDQESAYVKYEGWACNMIKDDDGDIRVAITHSNNYRMEFKFYVFRGEDVEILMSEWVPSSLQLTLTLYTESEEYIGDLTLFYGYLQDNWMKLFTQPKTFITLP